MVLLAWMLAEPLLDTAMFTHGVVVVDHTASALTHLLKHTLCPRAEARSEGCLGTACVS